MRLLMEIREKINRVRTKFWIWRQQVFLKGYMMPYVSIVGGLKRDHITYRAYGSMILIDKKKVFKIAENKQSTIQIEYKNYLDALRYYPDSRNILPGIKKRHPPFFSFLTMPRYAPIDKNDSIDRAVHLYRKLQYTGSVEKKIDINGYWQLQAGMDMINKVFGISIRDHLYQVVQECLSLATYHVGLAHGDFHSRNILQDKEGNARLIDLDCMRMNGIQELDALYFILELEWSRTGQMWYDTLANYHKGNISVETEAIFSRFGIRYHKGLGVIYMLDRIGQENVLFGIDYGRQSLEPLIAEMLSAD